MIKTKAAVFAGTWLQARLGEIGFGLDWVYLGGISPPSWNELVVRVKPGIGMPLPFSWAVMVLTAAANTMALTQNLRVKFMVSCLLTSPQHIRQVEMTKRAPD